jgi:hypothetical protein
MENKKAKTDPVWGTGTVGRDVGKRYRRVNMVEYYVLMYENGKMRPVETIPGMWGGGQRRMMEG